MARTLVQAGRARGLVVDSLVAGKREEAYRLCQMHYAVSAASAACGEPSPRESITASQNALTRFAEEFGLQVPPV